MGKYHFACKVTKNFAIYVMLLSIIMIMVPSLTAFASGEAAVRVEQNGNISLNVNKVPLKKVLSMIEKQSNYVFGYNSNTPNMNAPVTASLNNASISKVMNTVLSDTDLGYDISGRQVLIFKNNRNNKSIPIRGKVTDKNNEPLIGVTVMLKGSSTGAITDADGNFNINVPDEQSVLRVSFLGYVPQDIRVGNRRSFTIELIEKAQELNEVVVTALGMKRSEKALGYATQKVSGDQFEKVKGVNVATSMTGRIAGLIVFNSTEFMEAPSITLRGETPLLVLDGVPTNLTLADINSDDIESIDVLKGATASALYGSRGGSGAIMVTTKKSGKEGFSVEVNSSNMFNCGTLALPKVQTSYSSGYSGKYNVDDEVWGDKLDIGRVYSQYNPITHQMEDMELTSKGKDNFKNFLQFSMISNNTVSVTQKGKNGSVRASGSFIYDKGQYPNEYGKVFQYNIGGEMKLGTKVDISATMGFNKQLASNTSGIGYDDQGYIYNLLIWTGPEYDVREYRDYWLIKDEKQNWNRSTWYDNPWMSAYEKINSEDITKTNGMFTLNYSILPWLKAIIRGGFDYTSQSTKRRAPIGINSTREWGKTNKGYYSERTEEVFTTNDDFILNAQKNFGDFSIDALAGYSIYYYRDKYHEMSTKNGISIPGFYSLKASVESPNVDSYQADKQVNSLYGKASLGYKNTYYLDVTGRNDWSSTLPSGDNSYFYPSVGASVIMSNIIKLPSWWTFWKLRGSWTVSKKDLDIYDTSQAYTIYNSVWDGLNSAEYPQTMRGNVKPITDRTWEIGTSLNFLNNRLRFDFTYYNKLTYNNTVATTISSLSGFTSVLVNTDEEYVRRGIELFVEATPVKTENFTWNVATNWARSARYYAKIDPVYSADNLWTYKGARVDAYTYRCLNYDPDGNLILTNGYPKRSSYYTKVGNMDPDWMWGLTNTFKYKAFTFTFGIDGRIGGLSNNRTNYRMWQTGAHPDSDNQWRYDEVVNGEKNYVAEGVYVVSGEATYDAYGRITEDTRVFATNETPVSYESYIKNYWCKGEHFITDETFIKLRELSITYDVPQMFCDKLHMTGASVSLIGQNLLLWTRDYKYADPDKATDNLNSPSVRYVGVNIKLQF
jgi:TonB-linked SusC/RagA family outer membrane protein